MREKESRDSFLFHVKQLCEGFLVVEVIYKEEEFCDE